MKKYDDIIKRNEQLIDNVYDMNEEITELAYENEELTKVNEALYENNEDLSAKNSEMQKGIAELHKTSARQGRVRRVQQPQQIIQEQQPQEQQSNVRHEAVSLFVSEKVKKNTMFTILIFLILLLGLGIKPGTAINYQSLLDCYLELVFNLYNICILGSIGFILRKIWKKF